MDEGTTADATVDPRVTRTRQAVFAAAEKLLFEGGPAALTYSAVAEASGVGRATIYRHWPTIEDLIDDLTATASRRLTLELDGDLRSNLRRALSMIGERMLSGRERMRFLTMLQRIQIDEDAQRLAERLRGRTPVHHALRRGVAEGELPEGLDISIASSMLLGPLLHRGLMVGVPIDADFVDQVVDRFLSDPALESG